MAAAGTATLSTGAPAVGLFLTWKFEAGTPNFSRALAPALSAGRPLGCGSITTATAGTMGWWTIPQPPITKVTLRGGACTVTAMPTEFRTALRSATSRQREWPDCNLTSFPRLKKRSHGACGELHWPAGSAFRDDGPFTSRRDWKRLVWPAVFFASTFTSIF